MACQCSPPSWWVWAKHHQQRTGGSARRGPCSQGALLTVVLVLLAAACTAAAAAAEPTPTQQQQQQHPEVLPAIDLPAGGDGLLPTAHQPRTANEAAVAAWQQLQQTGLKWPSVGATDEDSTDAASSTAPHPPCSHEQQLLACGSIPVLVRSQREAFRACCVEHAPRRAAAEVPPPPTALPVARGDVDALQRQAPPAWPFRRDTNTGSGSGDGGAGAGGGAKDADGADQEEGHDDGKLAGCVDSQRVLLPSFSGAGGSMGVVEQVVPLLTRAQIRAVKAAALEQSPGGRLQQHAAGLRAAATLNGQPGRAFRHPGGTAGASELALLQARLRARRELQSTALRSLLTGEGVPPKLYEKPDHSGWWSPPVDTPVSYPGPYVQPKVNIGYGGWEKGGACPANYPAGAPRHICTHVAAVELDGQLSYKFAVAHQATAKRAFADNLFRVIKAWGATNTAWGMSEENGPLEGGWAVAAVAKALETLRAVEAEDPAYAEATPDPDWAAALAAFSTWFDRVLQPQMAEYIDVRTAGAVRAGSKTVHGNWHATIAEAWMAVGVLRDDPRLFDRGVALWRATTSSYLQWGRQQHGRQGEGGEEQQEKAQDKPGQQPQHDPLQDGGKPAPAAGPQAAAACQQEEAAAAAAAGDVQPPQQAKEPQQDEHKQQQQQHEAAPAPEKQHEQEPAAVPPPARLLGECTETLRDIYHSQFGIGGLLQAAEIAWQQDYDLYSHDGCALASAMELMARFINAWEAGKNESMLPPGYRFYDVSMPVPPKGCDWVFDIGKQAWFARDRSSMAIVSQLQDGHRYLLGVKHLPAGWEVGFNHYAGRLGLRMPETAALLRRHSLESFEFHWGLGTLTHADSAAVLFRPGVQAGVLCPSQQHKEGEGAGGGAPPRPAA